MTRIVSNFKYFPIISILIVLIAAGCSRTGALQNGNIPLTPGDENPSRLGEWIFNESGGTADLGWFALNFPEGTLTGDTLVTIEASEISNLRQSFVVGGIPVHVGLSDADPAADNDPTEPLMASGEFYSCEFDMNDISGPDGDFSVDNRYVDIMSERLLDGMSKTGYAWADRAGTVLSNKLNDTDITIALIDYSNIPELTEQPLLTDNPTELSGYYARYAQGLQFDPKNTEPLGDRLPVILIHGLQLDNMDIPAEFSDSGTNTDFTSWVPFFNYLNQNPDLYTNFKFYWYMYPTGIEIFGANGSGALLKTKINEWAAAHNEPQLETEPLRIVAHSMGGLVSRDFMQNEGGNIDVIITMSTPHYGSPIANIADDLGWGWVEVLLTPGVLDLACYHQVEYWYLYPFIKHTCSLGNPELQSLNENLPEDSPKLITYGATSETEPNPSITDLLHYGGITLLGLVTKPTFLLEEVDSLHSDCVVPWRSQYFMFQGDLSWNDWRRTSALYHTEVLGDEKLLWRMEQDLLHYETLTPF